MCPAAVAGVGGISIGSRHVAPSHKLPSHTTHGSSVGTAVLCDQQRTSIPLNTITTLAHHLSIYPCFRPFQPMEYCPSCYNANGPTHVKNRAIANTDPSFLEEYGGGEWPLLTAWKRGELAENRNYLEPDEIAVRHGVCGDPKQVRAGRIC